MKRRWIIQRLASFLTAAVSTAALPTVALPTAFLPAACSSSTPAPVSGYRILIESHDSLSEHLARALEKRGFDVRRQVVGGGRPTAALVTFIFPSEQAPRSRWFAARLADTRTGTVIASFSVPLDSLAPMPERRATQIADSLTKHLAP